MRKTRLIIASLLAALLIAAAGCSPMKKARDISVTSYDLEQLTPTGLRSFNAIVAVGIHNPTIAFSIDQIEGTVRYKGQPFATVTSDGIQVERKSDQVYSLPCQAVVADNISLLQLMAILNQKKLEFFTADLTARVTLRNGLTKTLTYNDVALQDLKAFTK